MEFAITYTEQEETVVVLDTNVVLDAAGGVRPESLAVIQKVLAGELVAVTCDDAWDELQYMAALMANKPGFDADLVQAVAERMVHVAVENGEFPELEDETDAVFLDLLQQAAATGYLLSQDHHLLDMNFFLEEPLKGRVMRPGEWLSVMAGD